MKPDFYIVGIGLLWWAFFEWLRESKRNRTRGTQHLCLLALFGLGVMISGLAKILFDPIF